MLHPLRLENPTLALSSQQICIKSGLLKKKGIRSRTWRKRWHHSISNTRRFVLRPTSLCYYLNDREYEILSILRIEEISTVVPVLYKSRPHVLCIVSTNRTFYLQCPSAAELGSWLSHVRAMALFFSNKQVKDGVAISRGQVSSPSLTRRFWQMISPVWWK